MTYIGDNVSYALGYIHPVLYMWDAVQQNFWNACTEVDRMFVAASEIDFRRFEDRHINKPLSDYVLHQAIPNRYWFYMFNPRGKIWESKV